MDRAGIETMLMNYYRHMDHSIIQFDFLCNKTKPGAYDEEIIKYGGKIYHTPGLNPLKYYKYIRYMKKLFTANPEYKIVEAHNGALGVYALHAAKKNNVPIRIFHAHGASINKDWKLPLKLFCKSMLPFNMNKHYTCGIEAAKCYFGKKITDNHDYELIPNAIEVEHFIFNPNIRKKVREENGLTDKFVVGHVGRFMTQKNHSFLLDVFAKLSENLTNSHLVLLGDGELMPKIKEKAKKLGLEKKISFLGNVNNVNEWYQAFDCFVLPSIWEGLPVVGVEAQASDLPCIFSTNITKEIKLSEKVTFLKLSENVSVWAKTIENMIKLQKRNDNTKLITDCNYNIKYEAKKLEEKYLNLAFR